MIYLWRVLPERRAEFAHVMRAILQAEARRHPQVLLNLTFGPAADGTHAEVQVFSDATANDFFLAHAADDPELSQLWQQLEPLCEPESQRSIVFDDMQYLDESFVRAALELNPSGSTS